MCASKTLLTYTPKLTNYQFDYISELAKLFKSITVDTKIICDIDFNTPAISINKSRLILTRIKLVTKSDIILIGGYAEPIALMYIVAGIIFRKKIFLTLERPLPEPKYIKKILKSFFRSLILRLPDGIIAIDSIALNFYSRYSNCIEIPYSLDFTRYKPVKKIKEANFKIIFIGQIIERKGVLELIEAFRHEPLLSHSDIYLDIFGDGELKTTIEKLNINPRVRIHPAVSWSSVPSTISKYDLFILPSKHDGWGVTLVEALLTGTPCVTTKFVGAKNFIDQILPGHIFETGPERELITLAVLQAYRLSEMTAARTGDTAYRALIKSNVNVTLAAKAAFDFINT